MQPPSQILKQALNSRNAWFWTLWTLALLLKLYFGPFVATMDVHLYAKYGTTLADSGFAAAYASDPIYNIPPLAAAYSALLANLTGGVTPAFAFFLKLPGSLAEAAFGMLLWRRYGSEQGLRRWTGLLVVLNPIALPVTGLHGNFDGLLAVFLGMAVVMSMDGRAIASALWFGLAANLKVASILLGPAFFFWWIHHGRAGKFAITGVATVLIGWSAGLIACPQLFLERVVGYGSVWGVWGISRLLFLTRSPEFASIVYGAPSPTAKVVATGLKLVVVAAAVALAYRRRKESAVGLAGTVAATWTVFFVFAPGGAAQYAIWPVIPFLLYSPRLGLAYMIAAIPFMLDFYPMAITTLLPFDPYPALARICPWMNSPYSWTWPALLLWATLTVIMVLEWPRWWRQSKSPSETSIVGTPSLAS